MADPDMPVHRQWWAVARRVVRRARQNHVSIVAAGLAFYALFAIFPALAGLISIVGLVVDPEVVTPRLRPFLTMLPNGARELVIGQVRQLAATPSSGLGAGAVFAFLLSLASATRGTKSLMTALTITYGEDERRGFFKLNAQALGLTFAAIVLGSIALGSVVVIPALLGRVGLRAAAELMLSMLRWPALAALVMFALAVVYRFGPSRTVARWAWVSWGAAFATISWLLGSGVFSAYVARFGNYNATYGSVGGVIVLLAWLLLSAYVVLLGAEINAELERRGS